MKEPLHSLPNSDINYANESNNRFASDSVESPKVDFPTTSEIYNSVFENSFHAVYIGTCDGHILRFNKKLCRIFGYPENEMINLEASQLFEINDAFLNFVNERNEKRIAKSEVTCIRKSGKKFPCRISSVIYKSDNGEDKSMNTLIDISNSLASRWDIVQ